MMNEQNNSNNRVTPLAPLVTCSAQRAGRAGLMAGILAMARGRDAVIPQDRPEGEARLPMGADTRTHAQMSPVQRSDMLHTRMNPLGEEHTRMNDDE